MRGRIVAASRGTWPAACGLAVCALVLVWITPAVQQYDGALRLARLLARGSSHFDDFLPWIEMFRHAGRDQLAYPPMVSFLLVPFVWAFGEGVQQPAINSLFILATAGLLVVLMRGIGPLAGIAAWAAPAYVLATPVLYSAAEGNIWLLMHSEGSLLLTGALVAALRLRCAPLAGFLFACAAGTRYSVALAGPAVLAALVAGHAEPLREAWSRLPALAAGAIPPAAAVLIFQWWTLGDALFSPYEASWREWGIGGARFSFEYVWGNARVYFLMTPLRLPEFPWLRFPADGQSLFVLSPFLLGIFAARLRIAILAVFAASSAVMLGFYLLYFWSGYAQYGSRYAQDLLPLLLPLAFSAFTRPARAWRIAFGILLALSMLMNAWGTYVVAGLGLT